MPAYRRGPLAGIEYTSRRQQLNAREYLRATGVVLSAEEAPVRARGFFGQFIRERAAERPFVLATEMGIEPSVFAENYAYFWARTQQANTGRIRPLTKAEFDRDWRALMRNDIQPGPELDRLLHDAGMRTGEAEPPSGPIRYHYQQYIKQMWTSLENVGQTTLYERIMRRFGMVEEDEDMEWEDEDSA